jgi:hypothetical protein
LVSRVLDISSHIGPCFPLLENCANFTPMPEENIQYSANYLCNTSMQQANPFLYNYTPLVLRGNGENKQLTLLIQRKLTFNCQKYTFWAIKSFEHIKNSKNGPVLYLGIIQLTMHDIKSQIHLVGQSL